MLPQYDRAEWRHWIDEDSDCQDTRQEVLIEESRIEITFTSDGICRVSQGQWFGSFTGTTVTEPGELDIDHFVPLANAHRSGGWAWTPERKRAFANSLSDPDHLIAVTSGANRSKGARGPDEWRPPNESYWCEYATDWIRIKHAWDLTATPTEADALQEMLATCDEMVGLTTTVADAAARVETVDATHIERVFEQAIQRRAQRLIRGGTMRHELHMRNLPRVPIASTEHIKHPLRIQLPFIQHGDIVTHAFG